MELILVDADELHRIMSALAVADQTLDRVLNGGVTADHPMHADLCDVGNWVRASHRRLRQQVAPHCANCAHTS